MSLCADSKLNTTVTQVTCLGKKQPAKKKKRALYSNCNVNIVKTFRERRRHVTREWYEQRAGTFSSSNRRAETTPWFSYVSREQLIR